MAWSTKDDRPKTDGSGNLQDESVQARDQDQLWVTWRQKQIAPNPCRSSWQCDVPGDHEKLLIFPSFTLDFKGMISYFEN